MAPDALPRRRSGWLVVLLGAGLALAVQVSEPIGVPLYDGVVVVEPYRFLHPADGQVGDPTSYTAELPIVEGVSPVVVAATTESPPQAQLIAQRDAFELTPATTSIRASITPIEPPAVDPGATPGPIAGNVYRFTVTDQSGNPLRPKSCQDCLSLVLRAPETATEGTIIRFSGGAWTGVSTVHAGVVGMYQSNPTALGDYAVVASVASGSGGVDLTLVVLGGGIVLIVLAFVLLIYLRQRPPPAYPTRRAGTGARSGSGARPTTPTRVPSKRRGPRRPPSGRSGQ